MQRSEGRRPERVRRQCFEMWLRRRGDGHSRADGGIPTRQGAASEPMPMRGGGAGIDASTLHDGVDVGRGMAGRHRAGRTSGCHLLSPARHHAEPRRPYPDEVKNSNSIRKVCCGHRPIPVRHQRRRCDQSPVCTRFHCRGSDMRFSTTPEGGMTDRLGGSMRRARR